ncbi:UNVERIFIED_CONTAM: hypothetical protein Scaly_2187000 [Sesamum calycinum]|uniref:RNase H type-1 domain-containing protein n=1 Tax=Sesamum calycinum TaxID=2727403 RepID=A0AAW2MNU3_9LAMI
MRMADDVGARHLVAYSDSQMIVKQVEGTDESKEENMIHYLQQIAELKIGFKSFQLIQIPREENIKADFLSKLASALKNCRTRHITIQHFPKPRALLSIQVISPMENPIIRWLEEGHLPPNRWDAARLKVRATRFLLNGVVLYKKSFTHPYFGVYPNKREYMFLKKYKVDVVEHMLEHGHYLTKPYELVISGP